MFLAGCQVVLNVVGGQEAIAINKKQIGCRGVEDTIIANPRYPKPVVFLGDKANRTKVAGSKGPCHAFGVIARAVITNNHLKMIDRGLIRD